jgi:hypothetical protein
MLATTLDTTTQNQMAVKIYSHVVQQATWNHIKDPYIIKIHLNARNQS